MLHIPASIRNKNPGSQYPGKTSKAFGSTSYETIGGGHKIATFPTYEQGAAALWALLERVYLGMTIRDAIFKWSGQNSVNAYIAQIERLTPFRRTDYIDLDMLLNPDNAITLARAMAWHEAGEEYPMTDEQWKIAHTLYVAKRDGEKPEIVRDSGLPQLAPLEWARSYLGEKEKAGPAANAFILKCFEDVGNGEIKSDEIAWCAAFVGAALKNTGYKYLHRNLLARGYLDYGFVCEAEPGALIILKRGSSSWQGHVAFVEKVTATHVHYIGGNQSNMVSRGIVSRRDTKILGFRRPVSAAVTVREVAATESGTYKAVGLLSTVSAMVWSSWNAIINWIANAIDWLASFFIALPDAASTAVATTGAAKKAAESAGLPWPVTAALVITVVVLLLNFRETFKRMGSPKA